MNTGNTKKENLTDIVFENRFKKYGAYLLRKSYGTRLIAAFIAGLSIILLLISSPLIASAILKDEIIDSGSFSKELVMEREIIIEKKEEKILEAEEPKKPQKKIDVPKEHIKTTPNKGVNFNVQVVETDSVITDSLVQDGSQQTGTPGGTPNTGGGLVIQDTTETGSDEGKVFTIVQKMPAPPYNLAKWLASNYRIPPCAIEVGLQGTVYVEFVVTETGEISDVVKKNDIGCGCGERAEETVRRMPPWEPGMQGGKAVKVRFTVPLKIKLEK